MLDTKSLNIINYLRNDFGTDEIGREPARQTAIVVVRHYAGNFLKIEFRCGFAIFDEFIINFLATEMYFRRTESGATELIIAAAFLPAFHATISPAQRKSNVAGLWYGRRVGGWLCVCQTVQSFVTKHKLIRCVDTERSCTFPMTT